MQITPLSLRRDLAQLGVILLVAGAVLAGTAAAVPVTVVGHAYYRLIRRPPEIL